MSEAISSKVENERVIFEDEENCSTDSDSEEVYNRSYSIPSEHRTALSAALQRSQSWTSSLRAIQKKQVGDNKSGRRMTMHSVVQTTISAEKRRSKSISVCEGNVVLANHQRLGVQTGLQTAISVAKWKTKSKSQNEMKEKGKIVEPESKSSNEMKEKEKIVEPESKSQNELQEEEKIVEPDSKSQNEIGEKENNVETKPRVSKSVLNRGFSSDFGDILNSCRSSLA